MVGDPFAFLDVYLLGKGSSGGTALALHGHTFLFFDVVRKTGEWERPGYLPTELYLFIEGGKRPPGAPGYNPHTE